MYLLKILIIIITTFFIQAVLIGCTNTSTVCYGARGVLCTTHKLSCPSPLVIQIINTSYGYRPECNDVNGMSDCSNTTCCNEESDDCFVPFSFEDDQQVVRNCSGVESCTVFGFRNVSSTVCGETASAYSKIQYDCVFNGISITAPTQTTYRRTNTIATTYIGTNTLTSMGSTYATSPTASGQDDGGTSNMGPDDNDTSDVGSIVGGIFGSIIFIVLVIAVVVFLYKRRKKSLTPPSTDKNMTIQTVTPQYHVVDGPGTISNRKDTSGYDEIELDSKPRVQATAAHLNPSTINNRNQTNGYEYELGKQPKRETIDNYDHVGDDKLKINSSKGLDNYNHIGTHDRSTGEDNYNHIGNNLSSSSNHFELDYNHINFNDEVDYNHIGDTDNKNVITDDNYHHIGSGDIKVEGDNDHIGSENDHYNHINNDDNLGVNQTHCDSINVEDNEAPYSDATC